ncbi:MAG TPA: potassium channel family protein [Clostridia bacterium]|nr:potassium channel family protein [Clostridia bacterium]
MEILTLRTLAAIAAIAVIVAVLWDAFETIVLPRRVMRRYRFARAFFKATWMPWSWVARRLSAKRRERWLSFYGPLSLIALLATWATAIMFAYALLHFGLHDRVSTAYNPGFSTYLYLSGTTLFTLGLGDVVPTEASGRALVVLEAGMGFGFLALVIGYFPVVYQAFSRREAQITLLDARAGSPPTATELLRRNMDQDGTEISDVLREWERWAAELMESHLSYPVLCYFRSQHDNESWLSALTAILDSCAFVIGSMEGRARRQAELTFAMARHAVVDLAQTFSTPPRSLAEDRLPTPEFKRLSNTLCSMSIAVKKGTEVEQRVRELREMYEPYVTALSELLQMPMPAWRREDRPDNWQTSAWGKISGGSALAEDLRQDEHL